MLDRRIGVTMVFLLTILVAIANRLALGSARISSTFVSSKSARNG
jgi:hypothetical protein